MGWFRRDREREGDPETGEDREAERSLLEIEEDPEMLEAQAEVDAEPLTPRSPLDPDTFFPH